MPTHVRVITAAVTTFIVFGAALAVWRLIAGGASLGVPDLPSGAWWFLAGALCMVRVKGRLGEYRQAARHTFLGVGKGHLALIRRKR